MGTITCIRLGADKYEPQPIPEVGKEYHAFDDGKIRPNRCSIYKITKIIPFNEADKSVQEWWQKEVQECYWLYNSETDYFIFATNEDDHTDIFVRTTEGNWFSLGWCGGLLDIDGSLFEQMMQNYGDKL